MSVMLRKHLLLSCAVLGLSACSLAPDYLRPDLPTADSWPADTQAQAGKPLWADMSWKQFFTDPTLQDLIQQSLDNNRDLKVAVLNIEVARATYRISESNLYPHVDANGSGTEQRVPKALSSTVPQAAYTSRTYAANLGVSAFELDLFGKIRSLNEQALESYLSTEEARRTTQITLVAEVANAYLTLLGDQRLLVLTQDTLNTRAKSLELIQRSFEHGVSSELDLAQARTLLETAKANLALYRRQVAQDRNALVLLLGKGVDDTKLAGDLAKIKFVEDLSPGLPSEVLLRRPDIMGAEHDLKAANAYIGAARAAFFPSISLTGSYGLSSPALSSLFQGASNAWSFAPSVSMPIFDAGSNQATLDSAKASRDIKVATYEKTVQTAFKEVSDALVAKATYGDQIAAQSALVDATRTSLRLSQARYDRGVSSYLDLLDSQRSLYSAEQDLISLEVSRLSNMVTLYKVLGGGAS
jgi:multidrug efflux system outer membrane protein